MLIITLMLPILNIIINNIIKKSNISLIKKNIGPTGISKRIRKISLIISIIIFNLILYQLLTYNLNDLELQKRFIFNNFYNFSIGLDSLNLTLITLTAFIITLLIYFKPENVTSSISNKKILNVYNDENIFINNLLILQFFLFLLFLVNDLFIFYILYELLLIPMFILIIRYGSISKKIEAAFKFFLFTLAGSLLMLLGVLFIYYYFKTFDLHILSFLLNIQPFYLQCLL